MKNACRATMALVLALLLAPGVVAAQTQVEPGFNLFTEEQDIEVGRRSAQEVENELPILSDREVTRYVDRLGTRLAEAAPGYDYPYQFDVVDVEEVNAFALPGGFMYVNRGLLGAVNSEAELAGVMAHEIAHVALRHGTNQASKAYLGGAGLSLLTGLIGGRSTSDIVGAVGGFGLNSLFLKFSRDDEREADILGAQILAAAGYEPMSLARVFSSLSEATDGSGGGSVPTFFASHPPYDERVEIVSRESNLIGDVALRRPVGGFDSVQTRLTALPAARSMEAYLAGDAQPGETRSEDDDRYESRPDIRIDPGTGDWTTFRHDLAYFELEVPDNWMVRESSGRFGVTFVPRGGMVTLADGREEIVYGVMIDHFSPENVNSYYQRWRSGFTTDQDWRDARPASDWLERASDQLVETLIDSNGHLAVQSGSERTRTVDGERAYLVDLEGHNPVTDRRERVTVVTRETDGDGHLVYALLIAPDAQWGWMGDTFEHMIETLRVNDGAVHRSTSDR